jgi:hypothetical protein
MPITLDGTNGITLPDGSNTVPASKGSTGGNTAGIVYPVANVIAFATSGVERARFDSDGDLGIGTTNPLYKLNVKGSSDYRTALFESSNTLGPSVQIKGSRIHELRSTDTGASEGGGLFFIYDKTAEASRLTVDSSGNVGIGTSSPSTKLTIGSLGALRLQTGSVTMDCTPTAGATDSFVWNTSANCIYNWAMAGTSRMYIDSSGRVTKPYQPYAAGSCSSAYTLTAAGFVNGGFDVIYGNVDINVGNHYNSTTGKFTAPVAGAYLVMYTLLISAGSTNTIDYRLSLCINNGQTMTGSTLKPHSAYPTLYISNIVYLNANDTVKARFWNDAGSGYSHGDANYQRFSIMLLG